MTKIYAALMAVKEIFSTLKSLWTAYTDYRRREDKKEIDKSVDEGSTIDIEEAIGSDNAGKPTKFRDGVQLRKRGTADSGRHVENESKESGIE